MCPWRPRRFCLSSSAYLAFPFDIVPDFIPVLGQLDDLLVIAGGLALFLALTPRDVTERQLDALD